MGRAEAGLPGRRDAMAAVLLRVSAGLACLGRCGRLWGGLVRAARAVRRRREATAKPRAPWRWLPILHGPAPTVYGRWHNDLDHHDACAQQGGGNCTLSGHGPFQTLEGRRGHEWLRTPLLAFGPSHTVGCKQAASSGRPSEAAAAVSAEPDVGTRALKRASTWSSASLDVERLLRRALGGFRLRPAVSCAHSQ